MMPDFGPAIVGLALIACLFVGLLVGVIVFLFTNDRAWIFAGFAVGWLLFFWLRRTHFQ